MNTVSNDEILGRIRDKRAEVERFLATAVPRKRRLLNTTIVGGSLAAALTAAPAVGGAPFTAWLATVATQLLKSNNVEQNIGRAQSARAKLEVLETSVTLGQLEPRQAVTEYLKCVEDAAFLEA
jgi:hypothetical protein